MVRQYNSTTLHNRIWLSIFNERLNLKMHFGLMVKYNLAFGRHKFTIFDTKSGNRDSFKSEEMCNYFDQDLKINKTPSNSIITCCFISNANKSMAMRTKYSFRKKMRMNWQIVAVASLLTHAKEFRHPQSGLFLFIVNETRKKDANDQSFE